MTKRTRLIKWVCFGTAVSAAAMGGVTLLGILVMMSKQETVLDVSWLLAAAWGVFFTLGMGAFAIIQALENIVTAMYADVVVGYIAPVVYAPQQYAPQQYAQQPTDEETRIYHDRQ